MELITFIYSVFLFTLINTLLLMRSGPPPGWQALYIVQYVPIYTLTPRFILGIRELYARDVRSRRGSGIDTGFGLPLSGGGDGNTATEFADPRQNDEGLEVIEDVPLEAGTSQSA